MPVPRGASALSEEPNLICRNPSSSGGVDATVDVERGAGDEAVVLAGEKHGGTRNIIPAAAEATADARVLRVRDWDTLEARLRERIKNRLIADTEVSVLLERRRPPLEATTASRAMAAHAARVYATLGRRLRVLDRSEGGGTDAAFAALKTAAPVVEGFGPIGAGAHSDERESIDLRSVAPRMYLLARMIIDAGAGKLARGAQ